jgi:hypothetical protein
MPKIVAEVNGVGYSKLRLATHVFLTEILSRYSYLEWLETGRAELRIYMAKDSVIFVFLTRYPIFFPS